MWLIFSHYIRIFVKVAFHELFHTNSKIDIPYGKHIWYSTHRNPPSWKDDIFDYLEMQLHWKSPLSLRDHIVSCFTSRELKNEDYRLFQGGKISRNFP